MHASGKRFTRFTLLGLCLWLVALVGSAQGRAYPAVKLRELMTKSDFASAGLAKLSASQLQYLESWLSIYTAVVVEKTRKVSTPAARPSPNLGAQRLPRGPGNCDTGHWIESVSDDGEIVKLEDGSIWQVDAADQVDSALWLPTTEILVCGDQLINTEDNEKATAVRLK